MTESQSQSFDMIVFGGSGDLAMRKLLPALYYLHRDPDFPNGRITAVARQKLTREAYLAIVEEHLRKHIPAKDWADDDRNGFFERIDYCALDAKQFGDYEALSARLEGREERVRVFYLATVPELFRSVCANLDAAGLITRNARVVLEKPIGRDLASANRINDEVGAVFDERQIYRIDHYLAKETVQNLIAMRFGNTLFEPLWRRGWISYVQITVAEQIGMSGRGSYYETSGALRDMVQNHLLQLLCVIAMEPPNSLAPDAMRDEKLKVLRALRPLSGQQSLAKTVRGQYRGGVIDGEGVPGYREEEHVSPDSRVETFVALKAELDSWRWAGVPFYLRTGKRLQQRLSEVVITFREVPHSIFDAGTAIESNRLVIRLQPDESVKLYLMAKVAGDEMRLKPVNLNLDFRESFKTHEAGAYERLLMDVIRGKLTLFMRRDEVTAAWQWIEPVLAAWNAGEDAPKPYSAGTWGPAAASALIGRDGYHWNEES